MDAPATPDVNSPSFESMLAELATIGVQMSRGVKRLMEIEVAAAEIAAAGLPETGHSPRSQSEADASRQGTADAAAALAQAVPRADRLARAYERLARSVRFSIALHKRLQSGWPRARTADDRPAMVKRQVAHGVGAMIRRAAEGESAERLFDELNEKLDDPALADDIETLPVEEIVRRICRDLGLVISALQPLAAQSPTLHAARDRGSGRGPP